MLGIFSQWCSYPYLTMPFSAFEMFKFERDFHVAFTINGSVTSVFFLF